MTIPFGRGFAGWIRDVAVLAIMLGFVLARIPRTRRGPSPRPFGLVLPLALFFLSEIASIMFSEFPEDSLVWAGYAPIAFLVFLAAQEVAVTTGAYRRLVLVLGAMIVVIGVDGVYQALTGVSLLGGQHLFRRHTGADAITASLPNPNDLSMIPILLPVVLAIILQRPAARSSWLLLAGLPFSLMTLLLSGSRNGWLGLAVGVTALAFLDLRRKRALAIAGVVAAVFVVSLTFGVADVRARAWSILDTAKDPRIGQWLVALEMFKDAPLVGKGVHIFGLAYPMYLERITLPAGVTPDRAYIPWAHNLYLEVLGERGLLGVVGVGAPLVAMALLLRRALRREAPRETRPVAVGIAASLLAFLAQAVFDLTFLKDWVLLVFWLLAALAVRLPVLAEGSEAR